MEKSFTWLALGAMLILFPFLTSGCMQVGDLVSIPEQADFSVRDVVFDMGGVNITIPLPAGYVEAPPAARQTVAAGFMPPENIFGVYTAASDRGLGAAAASLPGDRFYVISARPEFMREIVDTAFYRAMQRDLARVNGGFSSGRVAQFRALTDTYYARADAFEHSMGVYARGPGSLSIVRIERLAAPRGVGAKSVYPAPGPGGDADMVLQGWDERYFAGAYHQVVIQNVLLLNNRCVNIFFCAPLASESDLYAAMRENRSYLNALFESAADSGKGEPPPAAADAKEKTVP